MVEQQNILLLLEPGEVDGPLTSHQFKKCNSITEDISLFRRFTCRQIFRCNVAHGTSDLCGNMSKLSIDWLCQSKVAEDSLEIVIQEDVSSLQIPMYDLGITMLVQILQAVCCTECNVFPCWPVQALLPRFQICRQSYNMHQEILYIIRLHKPNIC